MKISHKFIRGFTLIELLIVIAIIAILTGIITTSLTPAKSRARDAKRISDLGNIQLAVSLFFDRCKQYPSAITNPTTNITCPNVPDVNLGNYITTVPAGPNSETYLYDVNSGRTDYILRTTLENYNEILKDDTDGSVALTSTTDCGTEGSSERYYCLGPR